MKTKKLLSGLKDLQNKLHEKIDAMEAIPEDSITEDWGYWEEDIYILNQYAEQVEEIISLLKKPKQFNLERNYL